MLAETGTKYCFKILSIQNLTTKNSDRTLTIIMYKIIENKITT